MMCRSFVTSNWGRMWTAFTGLCPRSRWRDGKLRKLCRHSLSSGARGTCRFHSPEFQTLWLASSKSVSSSFGLDVVFGVACIVGGPIACGVASAASVVASYIDRRRQGQSWKRAAAFAVGEGLAAKILRPLRMIKIKPRRMAKGVAPRATPRRASRAKPLSRWQKSGPWNRGSSYSRVLRAHPVRATFRAGYCGGYSIGYSLYGSRPRKRR